MEGTALIVEIERTVMVVSIRVRVSRTHMRMPVGGDWRHLIHVQGALVDQRDDPRNLRDNEERQYRCAKATNRPQEDHNSAFAPRHILGEGSTSGCGRNATLRGNFTFDAIAATRSVVCCICSRPLLAPSCRAGMSALTESLGG